MRISDWSSDVCSSDLGYLVEAAELEPRAHQLQRLLHPRLDDADQKGARDLLRVRGVVFADLRHVDQLALVGRRGDAVAVKRLHALGVNERRQVGRASWWERVCQYVAILVVAVTLKKQRMRI